MRLTRKKALEMGLDLSGEPQDGAGRSQRGRGVRRQPGEMNRLEKDYAALLDQQKLLGEIAEWHFDAVKLRLADKCFYTPDFMVMLPTGEIEFHEVKGFWEDDARVKIKVAARMYPFRFKAVTRPSKRDGWKTEEINP